MKEIYKEYLDYIEENPQKCHDGAAEMLDYLFHSTVAYHGRCARTLVIPKVFTKKDVRHFEHIVNTTYSIFSKIINEYLNNPQYRSQFPFSKELEELILVDRGYDCPLPIARFDIFYNEDNGHFKFCEINTDGTSAMNEDYVMSHAYKLNPAHSHVLEAHTLETWELYDSWVHEFMNIYSTYKKAVEKPFVAITDFLEIGSVTEFDEFKRRFEKAGYECEVCDIAKLTYDGKRLYSPSGKAIDAVYRRAVTSDICKRIDEIQPFINAVKDENVCLIGAFCTQIIHNKWLFKTLHEHATLSLLTLEERAFVKKHVPYTNILSDEHCNIEDIINEKDKWLIKPLDSYASKGVFAGCDYTHEQWKEHVDNCKNTGYVYQEYCPPYRTKNVSFVDKPRDMTDYTNMSGLFVYNGKFSGVYSRLSDGGIISSQYNEKAVPSYKLIK